MPKLLLASSPARELERQYRKKSKTPYRSYEFEFNEEENKEFLEELYKKSIDNNPDSAGRVPFTYKVKVKYVLEQFKTLDHDNYMRNKYPEFDAYEKERQEEEDKFYPIEN